MIENIIKRDGRIEPFDAEKITRWAEWAAPMQALKNMWPVVVVKVASKFEGDITSSELQELLIDGFLDLKTDSGYIAAGNLYAAHLRKIIYNSEELPHLKEVHARMLADGLIRDMGYTDQEYDILNSYLDHKRDFGIRHYSLHHIRYKYAIRDKVRNKEYETLQFVYMRMAMTVMEFDPPGQKRLDDIKAFYEQLSTKRLSAPTPNYVNFGTKKQSYASCCLFAADDTGASLSAANRIAYDMTIASAGLGFNLMTRSIGDPVQAGIIEHQGGYSPL